MDILPTLIAKEDDPSRQLDTPLLEQSCDDIASEENEPSETTAPSHSVDLLCEDDDRSGPLETPLLEHPCGEEDVGDEDGMSQKALGRWALLVCASFYASLNVSLRYAYSVHGPPTASAASCVRGWMTLSSFLPFFAFPKKKTEDVEATYEEGHVSNHHPQSLMPSLRRVALELALWNFTSQALNNIGLETTPSARASFLGQTSVVMVPLISRFAGEKLRWMVLLGCAASFSGLLCMSYTDLSDPAVMATMGVGDALILLSTLCWSFYILRMSAVSSHFDTIPLQASKNFYQAILYTAWFLGSWIHSNESDLWPGWKSPSVWIVLFYSAIGPGTIADLLQQFGQERAPPTESSLILSMEPVFTTIMGRVLLGEQTSWLDKAGGGCLIAGAIIASM